MTRATSSRWRSLIVPSLAALVALAVLVGLGTWQLQRKAWKEDLVARIEARAYGEAGQIVLPPGWDDWKQAEDEFRKVQVRGTFLHQFETPVYGLAPGQRGSPLQGFFLMTPLRLEEGAIVMVNRGIVPTPLREPSTRPESQPAGTVTVTGLVRAPQERNSFTPEDDPSRKAWFTRDPEAIGRANGLDRVAPFYVEADATPNPGGWPKGGQTDLTLANNHLQYAFTWFGIALTLIGVYGAFAWRKLRGPGLARAGTEQRSQIPGSPDRH